jgi:pimeloyl-ACP methyl ester carboxylesterase
VTRAAAALLVVLLAPRAAAAEELPPLEGEPLADLDVAGFQPAVVSLPVGTRGPRPVLVATHGNFDRPEWQCEIWREIVRDAGFVLCPRGVRRDDTLHYPKAEIRYHYRSNARLEQEIVAGLAALRRRFPGRVDPGPAVYTGFSQGAIMGVPIVKRAPQSYPRVVLLEGGAGGLDGATVKVLAKGGVKRVLFACGQPGCARTAKRVAKQLEAAGIGARVLYAGNVGHSYAELVSRQVRAELGWLVEGDGRWRVAAPPR